MGKIGDRIKQERTRLGWTQAELVSRMKTTVRPQVVSQWELGQTDPTAKNCHLVAVAMNVSIDWIITGALPKERAPALASRERALQNNYAALSEQDKREAERFFLWMRNARRHVDRPAGPPADPGAADRD